MIHTILHSYEPGDEYFHIFLRKVVFLIINNAVVYIYISE